MGAKVEEQLEALQVPLYRLFLVVNSISFCSSSESIDVMTDVQRGC